MRRVSSVVDAALRRVAVWSEIKDTPVADHRAVRFWLLSMAALIALMVLVGGATRLTESGFSTGMETGHRRAAAAQRGAVREAFDGYKSIPQYRELNAGMDLAQFKTIFWRKWSHRLLGRVIALPICCRFSGLSGAGRSAPTSGGDCG